MKTWRMSHRAIGLILTLAGLALLTNIVGWRLGEHTSPVISHTCVIPTPDSLYGGFRAPYPSAPFCGGR